MRRAALMVGLLLLSGGARATDEIEPLDGDFLEYLANLEGEDDNWTLLADANQDRSPSSQADAQASKTPKEAAQPPADER